MAGVFQRGRISHSVIIEFTSNLSDLYGAGVPVLQALRTLEKSEPNQAFALILHQVADAIEVGDNLTDALSRHPGVFNGLYVSMIRAGEKGGAQEAMLKDLSRFMEKTQRIKAKVKSAMTYPVIVLTMALGILFFLMTFIVPKFKAIFDDILNGKELPGITRVVMSISNALVNNLSLTIIGVAVLIAGCVFGARTPKGKRFLDGIKLNNPIFGSLFRKNAIARFARTLGTLLKSGVDILVGLKIASETSGNCLVGDAIKVVHDAVKEGEDVAPPMEATGMFPSLVITMVGVGEQTGRLAEMLLRIADKYDEAVDNAVVALTSIIEPIMIVILALIVGTIVLAIFLPMVELLKGFSS